MSRAGRQVASREQRGEDRKKSDTRRSAMASASRETWASQPKTVIGFRSAEIGVQISGRGDSAVYLLNPEVRTQSGEWEAWFFATWSPGAHRHRSFWEMMQKEYRGFVRLHKGRA